MVIAEKTKVISRRFKVMVHTNTTYKIETTHQENALAVLQAQNLQFKNNVKIMEVDIRKKTFNVGKLYWLLLVNIEMLKEVKIIVTDSLLHDHEQ
jgi:uncharacterized protein YchJ